MVKQAKSIFFRLVKLRFAGIFIFLLAHFHSTAQNAPDTTFKSIFPITENGIQYEKVFEVDSLTKKDLFLRIKEWALTVFNSQKAALQTEDIETGFIVYQGITSKTYIVPKGWGFGLFESQIFSVDYETRFTVSFYVKDFKFKIIVDKIELDAVSAYGAWMPEKIIREKTLDSKPIQIINAGNNAIADYKAHPKQKKYLIRLNYTARLWRDIHSQMLAIIESANLNVVNKKKSPFDF